MNRNVRSLKPKESTIIRTDALDILRGCLGPGPSQNVIERAAFEVSERLGLLEEALLSGDLEEVARMARRLVKIASYIGMELLARVAQDLVGSIRRDDLNAVASISRRLHRVGQESIFAVMDMTVPHDAG